MNDAGQFRLAGPVTVLCSARTVGAAYTLMRHLHTAGAVAPAPTAGALSGPYALFRHFVQDHIEPSADRMCTLASTGQGMHPVAPSRQ